ncbi:MAG: NUDIX hydrolase [Myxococcales bacterium]|nr:NUDIX hydrolase [Myxococcales bacterium]
MSDTTDPKKLSSNRAFTGRMIHVDVDTVTLPNGRDVPLEIVRHPGAAAIVPVDDQGNVILVRQYRYAADGYILEIPAGKLDAGEPPATCAPRELLEETGYVAESMTPLGFIYASPGFTDERIWLFLARGLRFEKQALEADEVLDVETMPFAKAVALAEAGGIEDGKSIAGLLRAKAFLS